MIEYLSVNQDWHGAPTRQLVIKRIGVNTSTHPKSQSVGQSIGRIDGHTALTTIDDAAHHRHYSYILLDYPVERGAPGAK